MSNEYKDWLRDMKGMTADEVLEHYLFLYKLPKGETPWNSMQAILEAVEKENKSAT